MICTAKGNYGVNSLGGGSDVGGFNGDFKSLRNFASYQQKQLNSKFSVLSNTEKDILHGAIQSLINKNDYSIRVNSKDLQSIIDLGFMNQFEAGKSGGFASNEMRKKASKQLFGNTVESMNDSDFEKYGYLGSKSPLVDYSTSNTWQYGDVIVKFNKENVEDRVTYTIGDSLDSSYSKKIVAGAAGQQPSITGIKENNIRNVYDRLSTMDRRSFVNADKVAQTLGEKYIEIQYHGKLTISDVKSVTFTDNRSTISREIVQSLKERGIEVYEIKNNKLKKL